MTENIQPVTQEEFENAVKEFNEISPNVAKSFLEEEDQKILFIGRPTCGFCRKYLPKLIAAAGENADKIYYLNSEKTAADDALSDFRFQVGAATVPSLISLGGPNQFENLSADSSDSVEKIASSLNQ